ncbi:MAG: hypothetical protein Q7R40_00285, partial [Phaeospirillum sp.]|nr:hypothetical protein [Phaeospirillum sp.]
LDVENGSAGSALVRLSADNQPKLFGETRVLTPLGARVTGALLAQEIERAAAAAIRNAGEVAARIRLHPKTASLGEVSAVAVFLAPPWGTPNLESGRPDFMPEMSQYVQNELGTTFEDILVSFYTSAGASAFGTRALFAPEPCLVCSITGEVSELMRMDGQRVQAHATIPTGLHALLRTLQTHGGLSEAEARSATKLPFNSTHPAKEAFRSAASEFSAHFKDAARELLGPGDILRVRVIAQEPAGEWFAQALSVDESLGELFPDGGEVRALRSHHLAPHIEARAEAPDLMLMLDTLFVDSHFNN